MINTALKLCSVALALAIASQSAHAAAISSGNNQSFSSALNLNAHFSTEFVSGINNSTTWAHATVNGVGKNAIDYYRFTINNSNTLASFDIDGAIEGNFRNGFDSYLELYDASRNRLATNDDGTGDTGSVTRTDYTKDSFLSYQFASTGDYFLAVSRTAMVNIPQGKAYTLNVSVAPVPEPETYALMGMGLVGLLAARRRKSKQA